MDSGSGLVETWIPDGGFEIQRRKVKAAAGGSVVTDCLVPKWSSDELTAATRYTASHACTACWPIPATIRLRDWRASTAC